MNAGIYAIRNIVNGKVYIGSAVNLTSRFERHRWELTVGTHHSEKLQRAWRKHGAASFEFEILEHVANTADLIEREQFWIDELSAAALGYNVCPTAGSALGVKRSSATIAKLSATARNRTPEQRAKYAAAQTGKKYSPESRAKMSASAKGKSISLATRAKLSAAGKAVSAEVRARIAAANVGGKRSEETRAKISAALRVRHQRIAAGARP